MSGGARLGGGGHVSMIGWGMNWLAWCGAGKRLARKGAKSQRRATGKAEPWPATNSGGQNTSSDFDRAALDQVLTEVRQHG